MIRLSHYIGVMVRAFRKGLEGFRWSELENDTVRTPRG